MIPGSLATPAILSCYDAGPQFTIGSPSLFKWTVCLLLQQKQQLEVVILSLLHLDDLLLAAREVSNLS